ncbi:MAG: DUF2927 domain-containing protein [Crocinitomicaceae bacterium]|jgi:hypothetical protein
MIRLTIFFSIITFLSFSQNVVSDYYNEIAAHSEYAADGITSFNPSTWKTDVKIFVKGKKDSVAYLELIKVINELNELINTIEIKIVDKEAEANIIAFFGWFMDYDKIDPHVAPYTGENYGLAAIYPGENNDWIRGSFYVDVVRSEWLQEDQINLVKRHIVREELTQSLGLMNDSMKYPDSIFYQGWSLTTEYSDLDKQIIKMHYSH